MKHRFKTLVAAISIGLAVTSTNTFAKGVYIDLKPALEKALAGQVRNQLPYNHKEATFVSAGITLQGGNVVPGNIHLYIKNKQMWFKSFSVIGFSTNLGLSFNIGEGCQPRNMNLSKWGTKSHGVFGWLITSIGHEVFRHFRGKWAEQFGKVIKENLRGKVPGC